MRPAAESEVRTAGSEDAIGAIGVVRDVYHEYGFIFDAALETPDLLHLGRDYDGVLGAVFVCCEEGRVIGTAGIQRRGADRAELRRLYVLSSHRSRGIGRKLLKRALDWARACGVREVFLWSDTRFERAHQVYATAGFSRFGERKLDDVNASREYGFSLAL